MSIARVVVAYDGGDADAPGHNIRMWHLCACVRICGTRCTRVRYVCAKLAVERDTRWLPLSSLLSLLSSTTPDEGRARVSDGTRLSLAHAHGRRL